MKFSFSWLQSFFDQKLPAPKVLAELLTQKAFETEAVNSKVLEVDILPNRAPDCLSYQGLAREIGAALGLRPKTLDLHVPRNKTSLKTAKVIEVEVKKPQDCQRYSVRLIEGIKIQESPSWIKQRLEESGLRPINNVVDLANYVMLETGQPLHVFDIDKIEGNKLIVRQAKANEKITTLDDKTYSLNKSALVIADLHNSLAIAGVKGGKKAEITKATKSILVEAANFSRASVRGLWKKMGLRTDASWRFENDLDLGLTKIAQNRFANLMIDLYQAEPASDIVDFYPVPSLERRVDLSLEYLEKLLGVKIKDSQVASTLQSLGFKIVNRSVKKWKIVVPSWRLDISGQADLVEEVARLYDYEKIPAQASIVNLIPPVRNWSQFWGKEIRNVLVKSGFSEALSYSFISEEQRLFFYYPPENIVEVANPVSRRQRYLRPNLLINLLASLKENEKHHRQIKIFEIGHVFMQPSEHYLEKSSLAGILTSQNSQEGFYQLKGIIKHLADSLVIDDLWFDNYQATPEDFSKFMWHPSRVSEIKIGDKEIGFLGEIHPRLEDELNIPEYALAFEINLEDLTKFASEEQEYRPVSSYPVAKRDLSVIVPLATKIGKIIAKINEVGGLLVRDVDLMGIYRGDSITRGKKSITLRIYFQAQNHTLPTAEINDLQKKIIKSLQQKGWIIKD